MAGGSNQHAVPLLPHSSHPRLPLLITAPAGRAIGAVHRGGHAGTSARAQEAAAQYEAARQARQEVEARYKAALQEPIRQKAVRQEAVRQEAARQEAAQQEAARQEQAARKETARQEARLEVPRQFAAWQAAGQEAEHIIIIHAEPRVVARQKLARREEAETERRTQEYVAKHAARQEKAKAKARQEKAVALALAVWEKAKAEARAAAKAAAEERAAKEAAKKAATEAGTKTARKRHRSPLSPPIGGMPKSILWRDAQKRRSDAEGHALLWLADGCVCSPPQPVPSPPRPEPGSDQPALFALWENAKCVYARERRKLPGPCID